MVASAGYIKGENFSLVGTSLRSLSVGCTALPPNAFGDDGRSDWKESCAPSVLGRVTMLSKRQSRSLDLNGYETFNGKREAHFPKGTYGK